MKIGKQTPPTIDPATVRIMAKYLAPATVQTMANTLIFRLERGDVAAGDVAAVRSLAAELATILADRA